MNMTRTKRILYPLLLLIIPILGMILSNEVNWSIFDFFLMGTMLLLLGLGINLVVEKIKSKKLRKVYILYIVIFFLIAWAELAVGIFGSPLAGS